MSVWVGVGLCGWEWKWEWVWVDGYVHLSVKALTHTVHPEHVSVVLHIVYIFDKQKQVTH